MTWAEMDHAQRLLAAAASMPIEVSHLVDGVLELHHPVREIHSEERRCSECDNEYPCNTVRVMAEALEVWP